MTSSAMPVLYHPWISVKRGLKHLSKCPRDAFELLLPLQQSSDVSGSGYAGKRNLAESRWVLHLHSTHFSVAFKPCQPTVRANKDLHFQFSTAVKVDVGDSHRLEQV